jgi:uncharacterized membrane protein
MLASAIAGGALVTYGLRRSGAEGLLIAATGAALAAWGFGGQSGIGRSLGLGGRPRHENPDSPYHKRWFTGPIKVSHSITVNRSPAELYEYWRRLENLPRFMKHLESVMVGEGGMSHWVAKGPLGTSVEWDAEITSDIPNERIGWSSTETSDVVNAGVVQFRPTADRGTIIKVSLTYEAPGGKAGEWAGWMLGEEPSTQIAEDLRRFKCLMETGTLVTVEGQTSGREKFSPAGARAAGAGQ